jgi:hypothetical protein
VKKHLLLSLSGLILLADLLGRVQMSSQAGFAQTSACPPLAPSSGHIVNMSTVTQLENAVNNATSGDTILIADGNYNLDGAYLQIDQPNVSLRSASGNREAVVLDGNYLTTEIVQIVASHVTVSDLTLQKAYNHPIHVMSSPSSDTLGTVLYNLHIIDPGQQAIKINPVPGGYYTDEGLIACSHIALTNAGRLLIRDNCYTGGVDAHQSRGWTIRDNLIEGFWCSQGLSEHGIHFWAGGRDTVIERNVLLDDSHGIGLGLVTSGSGRTYPDNPCPAATGFVDDYGGTIRNNFAVALSNSLFSSDSGFDGGISAWNACNSRILHTTVYSANPGQTVSSIEWRFPNTQAAVLNTLTNSAMRSRDGATATLSGNLQNAQGGWFIDAASGDLHLSPGMDTTTDQVVCPPDVTDDIDTAPRPLGAPCDIGADEMDYFTWLPILQR